MKRITSRHNPLVASFRAIARGDAPGLLLDGVHLIADALASPVTVRHAMVTAEGETRDDVAALVRQLEQRGVEVVSVPASVMAAVSPVRSPSPLVAVADRPTTPIARLYELTPLIVVAHDVQDPGNIGAIVRVTEASGGTGLMVTGRCADPYGPKALRGSMGSALRLPIAKAESLDAISMAKSHGCRVFAATPRGGRPVFDLDLTGPAAILIGGEGAGLPASIVSAADEHFTIPMQAGVESLNIAVTAAVVLYEAYRQRQKLEVRS